MSERIRYRVGPPSLIPDEAGLLVRIGGHEVGIFRLGDEFRAYENVCLHQGGPGEMSGWARVGAECEFRRPLHYMDEVEIELVVREKKKSSLAYDFVFRRVADRNGPIAPDEVASGRLSVVHVTAANGGRMQASGIPSDVARAIEVAPRP